MDLGKEFCRSTEQEPFIVDKGTLILGVDVVLEDWGGCITQCSKALKLYFRDWEFPACIPPGFAVSNSA